MTKTTLFAATALSALVLAGAANAQVITNVTVSGESRPQVAAFTPATTGANNFTVTNTALATTAAAIAGAQYLVANESVTSLVNRTASATTRTTAQFVPVGAAGAQTIGLLGGNTYQITLSLTSGAGVNARFANSVPASAFSFIRSSGDALPAGATANECDATDLSGLTIVSGGAANDTSVTLQFVLAAAGADTCNGTADLNSALGGVTITHPFVVDAFGTVGVSINTVLTNGTHALFSDAVGTAAQRARATVVRNVDGFAFTAAAVTPAAANASANTGAVDTLLLGATTPAFRTFGTNDGIASVNFNVATQDAGNAFAGLAAAALPAFTYTTRVNALNDTFGTTVDKLRPGTASAGTNPVGTYTVATGGASATGAVTTAGTATTVFINQGASGTPAASLALADQNYTVTVIPTTGTVGAVTIPAERTFTAGTLGLQGSSFRAPWVTSTVAGNNTVLRITNNAATARGPVELSIQSPNTTTSSSGNVCRAATLPSLANIPANGELSINSANLTTCFGEFRRGDLQVRILDNVPTGTITAKMRIVQSDGTINEMSLNQFSGAAAPF